MLGTEGGLGLLHPRGLRGFQPGVGLFASAGFPAWRGPRRAGGTALDEGRLFTWYALDQFAYELLEHLQCPWALPEHSLQFAGHWRAK